VDNEGNKKEVKERKIKREKTVPKRKTNKRN